MLALFKIHSLQLSFTDFALALARLPLLLIVIGVGIYGIFEDPHPGEPHLQRIVRPKVEAGLIQTGRHDGRPGARYEGRTQ